MPKSRLGPNTSNTHCFSTNFSKSFVEEFNKLSPFDGYCLYCLSKVGVNAFTIIQAKTYSNLKITSFNPGFIDTPMTRGFGASKTPEEGCAPALKCLFEFVSTGSFYGEDGLRSPLTVNREPGTPAYQGEQNPDPALYWQSSENAVFTI